MSKKSTSVFKESSTAKDYIRSSIDREIIKDFKEKHYPDEKLSYLGLPGEYLLDILSWREFLGQVTAVEGTEDENIRQDLELRINKNRIEHMVDLVYGNIDEILKTEDNAHNLDWPYHVVNLDYCGGLVNRTDDDISNRIDALRGLLLKQEGTAFLLFLTLNLRDRDRGEMDDLMNDMEMQLSSSSVLNLTKCFEQHREQGYAGRLKIYVPIFLMGNSPKYQFAFSPPILYQGTKQMMHFAIRCLPYRERAAGRIVFPNDYVNVINLPLLLSHEGGDLRRYDFQKVEILP